VRGVRTAALGACLAIVGATAGAGEPDFFVILNRAQEAVSFGAGKKYFDGPFSKAFNAQHPVRLSYCMKTTGEDEPTGFDMLVRLARDGRVESVLVNPESRVATCYSVSSLRTRSVRRAARSIEPPPSRSAFMASLPRKRAITEPSSTEARIWGRTMKKLKTPM
jgi:hypothetical protein